MSNISEIKSLIDNKKSYQDKLFIRGFYFSNQDIDAKAFPFYNHWKKETILDYTLVVHEKQHYFIQHQKENNWIILIGHAFNPFTMEKDENKILRKLINLKGKDFWNKFNELTGVFSLIKIVNNKLVFVGDATCKQNLFYCNIEGKLYLSSHINLINCFAKLTEDPYIKELSNYKFFHMLGLDLPADLTKFLEIKRLPPNNYGTWDNKIILIKRFYQPQKDKVSKQERIKQLSEILHNNMDLISQKWERPAISLTGGCDSKTTLASANGLYDKYIAFSFASDEREKVDADAAKKISDYVGIKHINYDIPRQDKDFDDIETTRKVINFNKGNYDADNPNDVRKRHYLEKTDDFDIEVKSWVSELGRTYYCKRFNNRKSLGKIRPRKCTTIYKFFLHNRKLVRQTDKAFKKYIDQFFNERNEYSIDWQDQFDWEHRTGGWEGYVITGEQKYSFDITVPYNNRKFLELFVNGDFEDKLYDRLHEGIRNATNPKVDEANIHVENVMHTKNRARAESIYYTLHTLCPL